MKMHRLGVYAILLASMALGACSNKLILDILSKSSPVKPDKPIGQSDSVSDVPQVLPRHVANSTVGLSDSISEVPLNDLGGRVSGYYNIGCYRLSKVALKTEGYVLASFSALSYCKNKKEQKVFFVKTQPVGKIRSTFGISGVNAGKSFSVLVEPDTFALIVDMASINSNNFNIELTRRIFDLRKPIEAVKRHASGWQPAPSSIRSVSTTDVGVFLDPLDPSAIKGRSNKDAIALVIGVAEYSRFPKAIFADNDANMFSVYAYRALGLPKSNIKVLVNKGASRTDMKLALKQWLRGRIEQGKTDVYVFFAGHGLASPDGKDLYLLPYDGATSLLDETSLLRNELFDVIDNAKPKSATVFLDTCYSGLSRENEALLANARPIMITPKKQTVPRGITVLSAASGQQISSSLNEAKHGLFSYYLMKGMEGPADANSDRKITAGELHAYVLKNVKQQAIRLGREQTPELMGNAEKVLVEW